MKTILEELHANPPAREVRFIPGGAEARAADPAHPKIGMRTPYNSRSEDMGFIETVDPHAFDKTLADGADVMALWNHMPERVLGRRGNGTLRMVSTPDCLDSEVDLDPDDTDHQNYARRVTRGDVIGSSFGFRCIRDDVSTENGQPMRTLLECRLLDLSPVTFPAYPASVAERRALSEARALEHLTKHGIDVAEMLSILAIEPGAKVAEKHIPSVRRWIGVLEGSLPAPTVPLDVRRRRLMLIGRTHGIELRWTRPTLADFTDKAWGDLTAQEQAHIKSHFAYAPADASGFGDLKLPYKDPKTGKVDLDAVRNALARLSQTEGIPAEAKAKIKAMLEKHLGESQAA